jgi:hypothetical protein
MKVENVSIRDIDIPIKNGTVRWLCYGGEISIEVEIDVHPTIVNYINVSGFTKERVNITSENHTEMAGKFTISTGTSGILLTSEISQVDGAEKFTPTTINAETFLHHSDEEVSLSNELKAKKRFILITFLTSLLDSKIKDKGNREFIYSLVEKLKNGQRLSTFDQYLMNEIRFLMEDTINDSKLPSPDGYTV